MVNLYVRSKSKKKKENEKRNDYAIIGLITIVPNYSLNVAFSSLVMMWIRSCGEKLGCEVK